MSKTIYDYSAKDIQHKDTALSTFKGKVVLIVNVASKCGLTLQYEGLQAIYGEYRERGFAVLGFPSNDFMGQEPGSEQEIATFCTTKYGVDFPMFSKVTVKGEKKHPLYAYLTTEAPHFGEIKWNFHKFLVDRSGNVAANIDPKITPQEIRPMIAKLL